MTYLLHFSDDQRRRTVIQMSFVGLEISFPGKKRKTWLPLLLRSRTEVSPVPDCLLQFLPALLGDFAPNRGIFVLVPGFG